MSVNDHIAPGTCNGCDDGRHYDGAADRAGCVCCRTVDEWVGIRAAAESAAGPTELDRTEGDLAVAVREASTARGEVARLTAENERLRANAVGAVRGMERARDERDALSAVIDKVRAPLTIASEEALDDLLSDLNETGINPVVVGFDGHDHPFLAYGYAPGGDGWECGFVADDTHSSEFDYSDGTQRCQDCGAFERRGIDSMAYPLRVFVRSSDLDAVEQRAGEYCLSSDRSYLPTVAAGLAAPVEAPTCFGGDFAHEFQAGVDTDMAAEGRSPDPRWCNVCGESRMAAPVGETPNGMSSVSDDARPSVAAVNAAQTELDDSGYGMPSYETVEGALKAANRARADAGVYRVRLDVEPVGETPDECPGDGAAACLICGDAHVPALPVEEQPWESQL